MYSIITYISDGVTKRFPMTFTLGYLRENFVTCRVDGELDSEGTQIFRQLNWSTGTPGWVEILGDIPSSGKRITFSRIMPKDRLLYDFQNGSPLSEQALDESHRQLMMTAHEVLDTPSIIVGEVTELVDRANEALEAANAAAARATEVADELSGTLDEIQELVDSVSPATETTIGVARVATLEEVTNRVTTGTEPAFITPETLPVAIPVGTELLWPATTPPEGWLDESLDLGELPRAAYPQLWEFAEKSGNILEETEWQNRKTALGFVGSFSLGDGVTTFRIPLLRRAFMRAADPVTGLLPGTEQGDAIRNIVGSSGAPQGVWIINPTGAFTQGPATAATRATSSGTSVGFNFDASRVVPTADENRPVAIARLPIIKAFGAVSEIATLEVAELLSKINLVSSQVNSPAHVQELAKMRHLPSPPKPWTTLTLLPWAHNLNLTPAELARCQFRIDAIIKVAVGGFPVGAVLQNVGSDVGSSAGGGYYSGYSPELLADSMTIRCGFSLFTSGVKQVSGNQLPITRLSPADADIIFNLWY